MESTLPGVEWVKTFEGIITEPKMVVFNDATNKKVIVEQGQEVEFATDDTLGIYNPDKVATVEAVDYDALHFTSIDLDFTITTMTGLSPITEVGDTFVATTILSSLIF